MMTEQEKQIDHHMRANPHWGEKKEGVLREVLDILEDVGKKYGKHREASLLENILRVFWSFMEEDERLEFHLSNEVRDFAFAPNKIERDLEEYFETIDTYVHEFWRAQGHSIAGVDLEPMRQSVSVAYRSLSGWRHYQAWAASMLPVIDFWDTID